MDAKKYPIQIDGENLQANYSDLVEIIERFQTMANDLEAQRRTIWANMTPEERTDWRVDAIIKKEKELKEENDLPF